MARITTFKGISPDTMVIRYSSTSSPSPEEHLAMHDGRYHGRVGCIRLSFLTRGDVTASFELPKLINKHNWWLLEPDEVLPALLKADGQIRVALGSAWPNICDLCDAELRHLHVAADLKVPHPAIAIQAIAGSLRTRNSATIHTMSSRGGGASVLAALSRRGIRVYAKAPQAKTWLRKQRDLTPSAKAELTELLCTIRHVVRFEEYVNPSKVGKPYNQLNTVGDFLRWWPRRGIQHVEDTFANLAKLADMANDFGLSIQAILETPREGKAMSNQKVLQDLGLLALFTLFGRQQCEQWVDLNSKERRAIDQRFDLYGINPGAVEVSEEFLGCLLSNRMPVPSDDTRSVTQGDLNSRLSTI